MIREVKERKEFQLGKGKLEPSLFAGDTILRIENPKAAPSELLELKGFDKVAGYKINIQESVAFLYTDNEISEKKIKETIPFTIASKK